jgi:hypothetical protein
MAKKHKQATVSAVVNAILKDADDIQVVLSPMVWHPSDNGKRWSFFASVSKQGEWHSMQIIDNDYEPPIDMNSGLAAAADCVLEFRTTDARSIVKGALLTRKPLVVHDCDDELYAARLCETIWPGERITRVRQSIERERASWRAAA